MILIFLIDLWKWQLRSLWCYHAMMHNGKLRGNNVTFNHFTFTRLWHELSHCENLSLVGRSLLVHVQWCAKLRFIRNARCYDKISDDFTTLVFILLRFSVNSQAWITQPFLMHVKNAKWSCQIFCQLFQKIFCTNETFMWVIFQHSVGEKTFFQGYYEILGRSFSSRKWVWDDRK